MRPAARITDNVAHPSPPVLGPGPGSKDVWIGMLAAWRGVPAAAAASLQTAKQIADTAIQVAEAAAVAASASPAGPAARAAAELVKAQCASQMASAIAAAGGGADIHACGVVVPTPPHGPGVVIDGSRSVLINNLPTCRMGDTILEAGGPPNKIASGETAVLIGG